MLFNIEHYRIATLLLLMPLLFYSCGEKMNITTADDTNFPSYDCFSEEHINDSVMVLTSLIGHTGWHYYPCWNSDAIVDNYSKIGEVQVLNDSTSLYRYLNNNAVFPEVNLEQQSVLLLYSFTTIELLDIEISYSNNNNRPTLTVDHKTKQNIQNCYYLICISVPKLNDTTAVKVDKRYTMI